MQSVGILIGRERGRKLAEELAEAFSKGEGDITLNVDAKPNGGGDWIDLSFTCEREWQDSEAMHKLGTRILGEQQRYCKIGG